MALTGCAEHLATGCPLSSPEEGHTLAPWVRIKFIKESDRSIITVGNKSSPDTGHQAVIKSFDFGSSDGFSAKITIHDQGGSSFVKFMEDLLKDLACVSGSGGVTMACQFGWVSTKCGSSVAPVNASAVHYMMPMTVETNFEGGKFMFVITANDLGRTMLESTKIDTITGGDSESTAVHLTDAVNKLLTDPDDCPSIKEVKFLKRAACGSTEDVKIRFKHVDNLSSSKQPSAEEKELIAQKGPKQTWAGNTRSKLDAAKDWVGGNLTEDGKSLIPIYDSTVDGGSIVFLEDPKPKPQEVKTWENTCCGTYIVNGGKDSRVISFNPSVKWNFASLGIAGGQMANGKVAPNKTGKNPGVDESKTMNRENQCYKNAGSETTASAPVGTKNRIGKDAEEETQKAQAEQLRAMKLSYEPIQADLNIIGDPTIQPYKSYNRNVTIVFINPYHLVENGQNCGEWLAEPTCNEVLSNKGWLINSITHKISEGSFVTTLGLFLAAPGVDIDRHINGEGRSVGGGPANEGWVPKFKCV